MWLGKRDLMDEHLVRTDEGVVQARSVRRLAEHSWSEENLRAVAGNTTEAEVDDSGQQEASEEEKEEPKSEEDEEMQEEPSDTKMTPAASSSSRGEKRTATQEATSLKTRVTMKTSTEKRPPHLQTSLANED